MIEDIKEMLINIASVLGFLIFAVIIGSLLVLAYVFAGAFHGFGIMLTVLILVLVGYILIKLD